MFFMDYTNRTRVKLWGQAEFIEDDPQLLARLVDSAYDAAAERALVFYLQAWDVNCRKHIQERWTQKELENLLEPLRQQITDLESENVRLRAEIAQLKDSFK
jgi:predicted pyridoxine 5'-phosphate oxidase superfamily flavin-nucleotide-binding protein